MSKSLGLLIAAAAAVVIALYVFTRSKSADITSAAKTAAGIPATPAQESPPADPINTGWLTTRATEQDAVVNPVYTGAPVVPTITQSEIAPKPGSTPILSQVVSAVIPHDNQLRGTVNITTVKEDRHAWHQTADTGIDIYILERTPLTAATAAINRGGDGTGGKLTGRGAWYRVFAGYFDLVNNNFSPFIERVWQRDSEAGLVTETTETILWRMHNLTPEDTKTMIDVRNRLYVVNNSAEAMA